MNDGKLLRILGAVFGVATVVGGMVGQGILRTPGIVAEGIGSADLIMLAWVFGGLLAMLEAFAMAELAAAIPSAGGPYAFVRRGLGPFIGTIAGWSTSIAYAAAMALLATVAGEFIQRLGILDTFPTPVPALGVLALLFGLNWSGTRVAGDVQVAFTALKGAILTTLILVLFAAPGAAESPPPRGGAATAAGGVLGVIIALRLIINTYDGAGGVVLFGEEIKDPGRVIPRVLFGSIAGVMLLYLGVNLALLHVLSVQGMAGSVFPAADALGRVLGPNGDLALTAFGVLSVVAVTHVNMMQSTRLAYALGREGDLPAALGSVAANGTPRAALTATTAFAVLLVASGTYESLVATLVGMNMLISIATQASAWRLRVREPELPRPYRMPLFPLPVILAVTLSSALLVAMAVENPRDSLAGVGILAVIAAADASMRLWRKRVEGPKA